MFLRTAPIHMNALFLDHIISKAKEVIRQHEDKHTSGLSHKKPQHFHPYSQTTRQQQDSDRKPRPPAWKQIKRRGQRSNGQGIILLSATGKVSEALYMTITVLSCVAGNSVFVHVTGNRRCAANCVTGNRNCACVRGKKDSLVSELAGKKDCFVTSKKETVRTLTVNCKNFDCEFFFCCKSCSFCKWISAKERCKSQLVSSLSRNKACKQCFLCRSVKFSKKCHKCPNYCSRSACRGQITPVLEKKDSPRHQPQSVNRPQRRLHSPLPFRLSLTRDPTITSCYVTGNSTC